MNAEKKPSTAMVALTPGTIAEAEQLAQMLCKASILPAHFHGKPADVLVALMFGLEVGLTPINALQSVYVVHGRPGMYADAMVGLVLSSGKAEYFETVEATPEKATCRSHRVGSPEPRTLTITIEHARRAGWAATNKKYESEPARMLAARAKSTLCKDMYPDVLRGMASFEELRDEAEPMRPVQYRAPAATPAAGSPVIDAEVVEEQAAAPAPAKALAERILAATDLDALAAVGHAVAGAKLGKAETAELRALYATRKRQLSAPAVRTEADLAAEAMAAADATIEAAR